jgi:hypothetical protein
VPGIDGVSWSPDGRRLTFAYYLSPNDPNGLGPVIATIRASGGGLRLITALGLMASTPAWSR